MALAHRLDGEELGVGLWSLRWRSELGVRVEPWDGPRRRGRGREQRPQSFIANRSICEHGTQ